MGKELYDLTNPQKSIWLTEQFYKGTSIENISGTVIIPEKVDFKLLEQAINLYIQKNDSMRTKFVLDNENIKQYFDEYKYFKLEKIQVSSEKDLKKFEKEFSNFSFDVFNGDLFKFNLLEFPDGHGGLIVSIHHLISDAWSNGTGFNETMGYYYKLKNNEEISLEKAPSYIDFINSEKDYLTSEKFKKDKDFWAEIFNTTPETATIPGSISKEKVVSSSAKRKTFTLNCSLIKLINNYCKNNNFSIFNFFIGVYAIYINKISQINNFVIGTPILNRSNFKEKHTSGMFVSTMPFKVTINPEDSFSLFASKISKDFFSIFKHQKYPYQYILEDIRKKDSSIPSLYNILISYQNIRTTASNIENPYTTSWSFNNNISDDIDIHLCDMNDTGNIDINYDYRTDKYSISDIFNTHSRILHIINQILENNDINIKNIDIVTPDEKNKILHSFNNTKKDYEINKTISQLFEEQVLRTPNSVAVVFEDTELTYKELNEKSNSLANYLRDNNIGRNDIVGIMVNRSLEMIISILAVLKSGGCYIPIDPTYPEDRVNYMLENSKAKMLLTNKKNVNKINFKNTVLVDLNSKIYNLSRSNLDNINMPDDTSYIIYTSGSTGKPKRVVLNHKALSNLTNYCNNYVEYLKNNSYRTIVSVTTVSFDIFIFETLISLQKGLKLVIASEEAQTIPRLLDELISKHNVEIIQTTPSRMQLLVNNLSDIPNLKNIKFTTLAGEPLPISLLESLKEITKGKVYNGYGPSETTVFSTLTDVTNYKAITIGKPLDNTFIYILNESLLPMPINIPGEIYIAGDGVGKGYLNNIELTKKSFIPNPFIPGTIMYKSGDLGYWNENGEIICLGRSDNQVKIRGLRIELEEIENKILDISCIDSCVVAKKVDENSHEYLCAYYTSNTEIDNSLIREYLNKELPKYMVPQYFVKLENLPYTPNGKIDRKKLPNPDTNPIVKKIILPRNNIDSKLIKILKELINVEEISIEDNFFDLGGDSLTAINLCTKIYSEFKVQIFVKDILENPIVKDLSDIINGNTKIKTTSIPKVAIENSYPVSSAQKRIFYACQIAGNNSTLYNLPGAIILSNFPDIKRLQDCFNILVQRHESLRTYFELDGEYVVQKIKEKVNFKLEFSDKHINSKNAMNTFNEFVQPFDLTKAPLIRAKLVPFEISNKVMLLVDMHHIVSDGSSLSILVDELCKLYNEETLPELEISYKDFSCFEYNKLKNNSFAEAENFWVNQFKNDIPVLNMPTNYSRPALQSFEGKKVYSSIKLDIRDKIENISKELGVTPFMFLLSCYYILLSKYTSQEDIVIGSPIVGRDLPELKNLIGMFVNSLPLRNNVKQDLSFKEFLFSVKEKCLSCFKYQTYPFDELVGKLNIKRDTSRNPIFDTMFIYQNGGFSNLNLKDISAEYYIPDSGISKFDLSLEIIPKDNSYDFSFEYCTKIFEKSFIENLSTHYLNVISTVIENLDIKISDISILSEKEKNKILYDFNNTNIDYPKDKTVSELFEEQVEKTPDNIAIIFEDKSLTYKELNEKANSLAYYLRENGISRSDIVGIMVNRSLEMIISILAVLKSGATYIPIDPTYPISRIKYILEDSNLKFILTQNKILSTFEELPMALAVDLSNDKIYSNPNKNLSVVNSSSDAAYIIYTSGSTGKPKGVAISHRNIVNFIVGTITKIPMDGTIVSVTTMCFDIFVLESLLPLVNGLKIIIANESEQNIPKLLNELCLKNSVDIIQTTPARMNLLISDEESLDYISKLKVIMLGGESFPEKLLLDLKLLTPAKIFNMYGPTETTVWSSIKDLTSTNNINIGEPIANTQMYILDNQLNVLPIGLAGNLYIGGDGLSSGYFNRPKLTAEKFIPNPFNSSQMIYNTGDLAKWNEYGEIEYIGRSDFQVKVRGLRIELGEIEKQILDFPKIDMSCVCVKFDSNDREILCGYFVSKERINTSELKNHLSKFLPNYMIPSFLIQLEDFKYTPNGKIDRSKLPLPKVLKNETNIVVAKTPTEILLAKIWENLLGISPISIDSSFFEIGGDSILALKMQIELLNENINISYADIFKYNTIKELANRINNLNNNKNDDDYIPSYDFSKIDKILNKNTIKSLEKINKTSVGNVLLTGATGFLGAHILSYLLDKTDSSVYCIIRKDPSTSTEEKLMQKLNYYFNNKYNSYLNNRLFVLTADLEKENLGLSISNQESISKNIDCVINSAAIVRHYGDYSEFERVNVNGVKNLIDFCLKYNKKLIQISTISVSGNTLTDLGIQENNFDNNVYFKENNLYIGQPLNNVYVRSKFEAEKLILENIVSNSLNALILRVGNLTNRFTDGKFQPNASENAFLNRLKAFIELKSIPKYMLNNYVEFSPVDLVAEAIVKAIKYSVPNVTVLHVYNQNHVFIKDLINMLPKNMIEVVSDEKFKNILNKNLQISQNKDIISYITNDLDKDKNLVYISNIKIKNDFSKKYFDKIHFKWKKIDKRYIRKLLKII